jgi:hypothetical protein
MEPREWVRAAKDLLKLAADPNVLVDTGPGSQLRHLLDVEPGWRDRSDDVPPEEERRRLLMEEERGALQELVSSVLRAGKVSYVGPDGSPTVATYRLALELRAKITGRTPQEVEAAAHGKDPAVREPAEVLSAFSRFLGEVIDKKGPYPLPVLDVFHTAAEELLRCVAAGAPIFERESTWEEREQKAQAVLQGFVSLLNAGGLKAYYAISAPSMDLEVVEVEPEQISVDYPGECE